MGPHICRIVCRAVVIGPSHGAVLGPVGAPEGMQDLGREETSCRSGGGDSRLVRRAGSPRVAKIIPTLLHVVSAFTPVC